MPHRSPTASTDLVNIYLRYAASLGIDAGALLAASGILPEDVNRPDARIPIERFNMICHVMVQHSGDENFGLHMGEATSSMAGGGILSAVMMNCATVEKAFEKQARYNNLVADSVRLRLSVQADCAYYIWETVDDTVVLDRSCTESVFCSLLFQLRQLTQGKVRPVKIHFKHACPADTSEYRRIFGCPLAFDCPRNALVLRREDLAYPIFLANPRLLDQLEQIAQETLERLYPAETWADRVIHHINQILAQGEKPHLRAAAAGLALSPRQVQNKLKEEGLTYQELLDDVRKEMALRYLGEPQVSMCDIAFLLGFSEQSTFNHAFKRWTGCAPGEYRTPAVKEPIDKNK